MLKLNNPIPNTVIDPLDIQETVNKLRILPPFGVGTQSAFAYLNYIRNLTELSETFNSVIDDICFFTFGLSLNVKKQSIAGIDDEESAVLSVQEKRDFAKFWQNYGIGALKISDISKQLFRYLKDSGNAYLCIKRVKVGDTVKYFFETVHYLHAAYLLETDADGTEYLVISKRWNMSYMARFAPKALAATRFGDVLKWTKTDNGIEEAVIHIQKKNDNSESKVYGRPSDVISIIPHLYVDYAQGLLQSKIAATETVTKKVLLFEKADPNIYEETPQSMPIETHNEGNTLGQVINYSYTTQTPFQRNMKVLKNLTTTEGETPSSMAGIEYPFGSKAPTAIDIEMNRDTAHHKFQSELAENKICARLGWSPIILGVRQVSGSLGGNVLKDTFQMFGAKTVIPLQNYFETFWNDLFSQIGVKENAPQNIQEKGWAMPNMIETIIAKLGDSPTNAPM